MFENINYYRKGHDGSVRGLASTYRHMVTIGDDGKLVLYNLDTFDKIRSLDILEWCNYRNLVEYSTIPRKLTCISIQEDEVNGGLMVVGTSFGEIIVMSIGTCI